MIATTLGEIAQVTRGSLQDGAESSTVVDGPVVVDSRRIEPGGLFVCIVGEQVDGHDFAASAIGAGGMAAVAAYPVGVPAVVVDDPVLALGAIAADVLRRTPDCAVVGVTGSAGKTSTKDLLGAVFAAAGETIAPEGNYNNEYGLPLTVLRVRPATRTLVLEYGARAAGHITYLCSIAQPRISVVLNVGAAHLGEFGSREVTAAAKGELVEALPQDGVAVLNADDELVLMMAKRTTAPVMTFGTVTPADVRVDAMSVDELARPRFRLSTPAGRVEIALQLHGVHHASNAAAATAAGLAAGLPLADIAAALSASQPASSHRMRLLRRDDGLMVIDDAYNASPDSMRVAIEALAKIGLSRRRTWAVLGPMRELGTDSDAMHRQLGREVAKAGIDELLTVGVDAGLIADGTRDANDWGGAARAVDDVDRALSVLRAETSPEDVVLVKASNSERLWRLAESLLAALPAGARQ
jgi:UDP-N-acetylmuramoyl-tripeptide--D-alanyl-D-alanine ligase